MAYIDYKIDKKTGRTYARIKIRVKDSEGIVKQFYRRVDNERNLCLKNFQKIAENAAKDFQAEMDFKCSIPPKPPVLLEEVKEQLDQIQDIKYDLKLREEKERRVKALGIKSFPQLAAEWLDGIRKNYSASYYVRAKWTIYLFNLYLNDIYALNKPICDITVRQIQDFLSTRFDGQSVTTVKGHKRILHTIFNEAYRYEWITRNPVALTKVGNSATPTLKAVSEKEIFSLKEAREFIDMLNNLGETQRNQRAIYKTILFTGVRAAEMLGLRWEDVDFEKRLIHVRRNRLYTTGVGWYEKEPKTKTSLRSIPMPQELYDELTDFYEWYKRKVPNLDEEKDKYYVACTLECVPIFSKNISNYLTTLERKKNIKHVTPHGLRHTYCSILLANNVPIQTVSKYMGHSDSSITLRVYSHFIPESANMVISAIDSAFADEQ